MAGSTANPRAAFLISVISLIGPLSPITAAEPSRADLDFFEGRIRPILVNNCYKCHSQASEKLKGGLRLDTQADLLKGGNTGPVIVPGHPENSLLIKAVRYRDEDLKMPPNDKKLSDAQIADLEQWVKMGAPDSRTSGAAKINLYEIDKANAAKHWAFQPIFDPREPKVDDAQHWVQTPVDRYILSRLRAEGLTPSPKADKVTLIRRATFDLTGLPPTLKEVDDFVADNSENAFSNVVVRLLASPRYGERWGRAWLDVARYADTKGSAGNNSEPRYLNSFTYRDYVIKSFNDDLPYDRFLLEQIAADKLPGENKAALAALGFLTLGNRFNNNADDIIDDRIDVICKATLALTVNCARCHDHKFDPIPTQDYYSLHGVFSSCYEPADGLPIQSPEENKLYPKFKKELETRETELRNFRQQARAEIKLDLVAKSGQYLLAIAEFHDPTNQFPKERVFASHNLNRRWAGGWETSLESGRLAHARVFAPWTELAALNEFEFPAKVAEVAAKYRASSAARPLNPLVAQLLSPTPASLNKLAARYATLFADAEKRWQTLVAEQTRNKHPEPTALPDLNLEEIRQLFYDSKSPLFIDEQLVTDTFNRSDKIRGKIQALEKAINDLKATHPGAPLRATVLVDKDDPRDSSVYLRGNPGNRGPSAPRRFLAILSPDNRPPFRDGSGRLELAQAIASDENPLTARVMVNRIWLGHFGEGLVRTPNDFGMRSEEPSHPELLDYLAWVFMEGWSIKKMHQLIMLSSVYQQSSEDNPQYASRDPNNRWLWRMNRRRLDFEALRDTILAVGGKLDLTMGGRPVKLDAVPYSERRTVYGLVDRGNLPTMYRAFDFANPDLSTGKRDLTTVPQQALFLMNSPLVVEQAMNLVRRPDFTAQANTQERVRLLYRLIYQRYPTRAELRLALTYLNAESAQPKAPIPGESPWDYGLARFDANFKRVSPFRRMAQFGKGAWVEPSGANLTAVGGYAPPFAADAVVRRWTSPVDGVFSIQGALSHSGSGGVHARIISSQSGELGNWNASDGTTSVSLSSISLTEGDTIDFMVECQNKSQGENFTWSPVIRLAKPPVGAARTEWNAQTDFSGAVRRHLHFWEKFAQVLLETNELTFYN